MNVKYYYLAEFHSTKSGSYISDMSHRGERLQGLREGEAPAQSHTAPGFLPSQIRLSVPSSPCLTSGPSPPTGAGLLPYCRCSEASSDQTGREPSSPALSGACPAFALPGHWEGDILNWGTNPPDGSPRQDPGVRDPGCYLSLDLRCRPHSLPPQAGEFRPPTPPPSDPGVRAPSPHPQEPEVCPLSCLLPGNPDFRPPPPELTLTR